MEVFFGSGGKLLHLKKVLAAGNENRPEQGKSE